MREILYRGKKKSSSSWIFGGLIVLDADSPYWFIVPVHNNASTMTIMEIIGCSMEFVDPETICQYTGLTDKNGRKIFEGDICNDGYNIVRILWNDKHQWGVEIVKTDNVLSRGLIFPLWQYDKCEENGNRE